MRQPVDWVRPHPDLKGLRVGARTDLSPLRDLTNLTTLYLGETQVADLSPLRDLTNLEFLVLNGTQVAQDQLEALEKALPKLSITVGLSVG